MARNFGKRKRGPEATVLWLVVPALVIALAVAVSGWLPVEHGGGLFASSGGAGEGDAGGDASAAVAGAESDPAAQPPVSCSGLEGGSEYVSSIGPPGPLAAPSAVVVEMSTGEALYQLNAHDPRAPASLTKIATALVTVDRAGLDETVTVEIDGAALARETDSTVMGLEPGQTLSVRDLLYGLLLPSGNDAALALAEYVGGGTLPFAEMMNAKALELGLYDSHFVNPHGLDAPNHYTSAYDIAMLGRALMRHSDLAAIVGTHVYTPAWDGPSVWNGNRLLNLYPGVIGTKTGFTDNAGQTIVATAERDGLTFVVSVMGSEDVHSDAIRLLDWAFSVGASACGGQGGLAN
jgi:D-alanyl-D-alanine carboxypeptidase (penicillin-binding protein 5/6)